MNDDDYNLLEYLRDVIGRGVVAGGAGSPIDIADLVAQYGVGDQQLQTLAGPRDIPAPRITDEAGNPLGGSEWLGGKMQEYGLVSDQRNPIGEVVAGVASGFAPALRTGAAKLGRTALPYLERATDALGVPPTAAVPSYVIKPKGGNWLSGSVEDALGPLKRTTMLRGVEEIPLEHARNWPGLANRANTDLAINDWIDKQLTRYVKNEMATPEDPVRALAERGVLHYTPEPTIGNVESSATNRYRLEGGQQGVSDLAKSYEDITDSAITGMQAGAWKRFASPKIMEKNPWISKLPDEQLIYERTNPNLTGAVGFDHLIDELRNATNPDSGLPPELLLKYESLPKVSVPQAVERVAKINAWRAAQKAEADAALANNAATQMVKEYPEGYRWVELRATGRTDGPASAEYLASKDALAKALKYEGDTMGHCVGGYCDDVASGRSRIYSLRDAKGRPHVTIEVGRDTSRGRYFNEANDPNLRRVADMTDDELQATIDKMGLQAPAYHTVADIRREANDLVYRPGVPYWLSKRDFEEPQPRIVQIKGKGNRKPNPEYIPFVQDFVKTQGQWSDVGDFANTDLVDLRELGNEPFIQRIRDRYKSDYVTKDEWDNPDLEGYAEGGPVQRDPNAPDPFLPDAFNDEQFRADVRQNFDGVTGALGDKQFWADLVNRALAGSAPVAEAKAGGYAKGGKVGAVVEAGKLAMQKLRENPRFAEWFGESKVVDEAGEPLVVYHGTTKDFTAFDPDKRGATDHGWYGIGAGYFTPNKDASSSYSIWRDMDSGLGFGPIREGSPNTGAQVMPVYLSLQNPYIWPKGRKAATTREEAQKITDDLIDAGYDGVLVPNEYADGIEQRMYEIVTFRPEQIKSAVGNRGTYDPKDPRITYAKGGPVDFNDDEVTALAPSQVYAAAQDEREGYAAGGIVKASKAALQKLKQLQAQGVKPMFHGGTYPRGELVDRPLYLADTPGFAETYVRGKGLPGAKTKMLFPDVKSTASADQLSEFIRKYMPENEEDGYTPASAFDTSLHSEDRVARLINKLWDYDFDSARGFDVGMDAGQGGHEGEVLIMLPGTRAYAEGGPVQYEPSAIDAHAEQLKQELGL